MTRPMTATVPTIRRLTEADVEIWRAIRLEALRGSPDAFGQTVEHAERQPVESYRATVAGAFPPFAAFDGAAAVGTAGFYIMGGEKMAHRGVLWGMYVTASHRGCGLGRRLIGAVIDHARGRVEQIHLNVVTSNAAAYALYRRAGFEAYGIEPKALRYKGRDYDETMMVRHLERNDEIDATRF